MIIKNEKTKVDTNFELQGCEIKLSKDALSKMANHVTKNLYSNKIGSIVREYVSNAYDAHIDKGKSDYIKANGLSGDYVFSVEEINDIADNMKPIHISITEEGGNNYFIIRDFGLGMSQDEIDMYFKNIGNSSKDKSNDGLGAYGVGSKSFQTYTNTCYYSTIHEGVQRDFMMIATEGLPRFEPLGEDRVVDGDSGTIVKFNISSYDRWEFISECKKQLLYFKRVYFETNDSYLKSRCDIFNNDWTIFETDTFMYNTAKPLDKMHAVLGVVAYPIDFKKIGLDDSIQKMPIGIKFNVGDFGVTLSREDIVYSPATKKLIRDKVIGAIGELIEQYNKSESNDYDSLGDYFRNYTNTRYIDLGDEVRLNLPASLVKWSAEYEELPSFNEVTIDGYDYDFTNFKKEGGFNFFQYFSYKVLNDNARLVKCDEINYDVINNDSFAVYYSDKNLSIHTRRFIFSENTQKNIYIFKSNHSGKVYDVELDSFADALGFDSEKLTDDEREECREVYLRMVSDTINAMTNADNIVVSDSDKKTLKDLFVTSSNNGGGVRRSGTITMHHFVLGTRYPYRPKTVSSTMDLSDLEDYLEDNIVVYCVKGDEISRAKIAQCVDARSFPNEVKFMMVVKSNVKHLCDYDNVYTYDEFISSQYIKDYVDTNIINAHIRNNVSIPYHMESKLYAIDKIFNTNLQREYRDLRTAKVVNIPSDITGNVVGDGGRYRSDLIERAKLRNDNIIRLNAFNKAIEKYGFVKYFDLNVDGVKKIIDEWLKYSEKNLENTCQ